MVVQEVERSRGSQDALACQAVHRSCDLDSGTKLSGASASRMPVVFAPHGGGPFPALNDPHHQNIIQMLKSIPTFVPKPKCILIITAHWEAPVTTISTHPKPPMYFDFFDGPPEAYMLDYPCATSLDVAERVKELMSAAGLPLMEDPDRGIDHGTFIPLLLMHPEGDIPILQMSVLASMDPASHVQVGRALAPLRDEGVFIFGSGFGYHNLGVQLHAFPIEDQVLRTSLEFDGWLIETCTKYRGEEMEKRWNDWEKAPSARWAQPTEEHLMPLIMIAGAADGDVGDVFFTGVTNYASTSAVRWGTNLATEGKRWSEY